MNDKESFVRYDVNGGEDADGSADVEVFTDGVAPRGVTADVTVIVRDSCETETVNQFLEAALTVLEQYRMGEMDTKHGEQ